MLVTLATFQPVVPAPVNWVQLWNMLYIFSTFATFQELKFWLKTLAFLNAAYILVTLDVSQPVVPPLMEVQLSNVYDKSVVPIVGASDALDVKLAHPRNA